MARASPQRAVHHVIFYHRPAGGGRGGGGENEAEDGKEKERERERERAAGFAVLLFRLLESRLVSEAGGQSEACFHGRPGRWPTNPAASRREHATSRVHEHLPPCFCVSLRGNLLRNLLHDPSPHSLSLSLSFSFSLPFIPRVSVCLSVCPVEAFIVRMCLWLASHFVLLTNPAPLSLSLSFSLFLAFFLLCLCLLIYSSLSLYSIVYTLFLLVFPF